MTGRKEAMKGSSDKAPGASTGDAQDDGRPRGATEDVHFFGSGSSKMFGCLHSPRGQARAGVVVCSPLDIEARESYRREVLLARSLATHGLAVQRFHYRGAGNSDGESGDATTDTMREDALAAAEWLKEKAKVTKVAFVGTRWGAMVAAGAAAQCDEARLVLWEPVIDGARYFRELVRRLLIRDMMKNPQAVSSRDPLAEFRQAGFVDVLGYRIDHALYQSGIGRTLAKELGEVPRSILLVQISGKQGLLSEYRDLLARCKERGFSVESEVIGERIAWGFSDQRSGADEGRPGTQMLLKGTRDWLRRQFP